MKKTVLIILAVSILTFSLCACNEGTVLDTLGGIFGENEKAPEAEPSQNENTTELTKDIEYSPDITGEVIIAENLAEFAVRLFDKCADDKNTVTSPYSVIYALAVAQNGAAGETFDEFEKLFGIKKDTLDEFLKISLIANGNKLKVSNSIWIRNSFKDNVKEKFLTSSKENFSTEVFISAFGKETLIEINEYISEKTEGLIKNALDEIDEQTLMYLINTVCFKADWEISYIHTYEGEFKNTDGSKSTAEYMSSLESKFISNGKAKGFIKNYKGGNYAFAAILPNDDLELDEYVSSLTGKELINMLKNPQKTTVDAKLPKFETEYKADIKETLKDMGLKSAFSADKADFSNMVNGDGLYISRVIHNAVIKADEKGTEAAAVTIIENKYAGMTVAAESVKLDRPFMYVIFDTETYTPVFMGQITNFK